MTRDEFYENLSATNLDISGRFETCKYFIENYPVSINQRTFTGINKIWTKLNIPTLDSSNKIIESNYNKLVKRINELKKFDNGLLD